MHSHSREAKPYHLGMLEGSYSVGHKQSVAQHSMDSDTEAGHNQMVVHIQLAWEAKENTE